jgi:hypothetical protein
MTFKRVQRAVSLDIVSDGKKLFFEGSKKKKFWEFEVTQACGKSLVLDRPGPQRYV